MSCNIIKKTNGAIDKVVADNGNTSILYKEALNKFGKDEAMDIYLASKSDNFQDNIILSKNELDVNNEPKLKTVLNYLSLQNESKEPLTIQQKLDLKNISLGIENFSVQKLVDTFYSEGIFNISPKKLKKSGLYSEYEIVNLANDINLQERVKQSLEALKNTEEVVLEEQHYDNLEKSQEINSFGKLTNINPYTVQKEIIEKLASTTEEEFEAGVSELEYPNFQSKLEKPTNKSLIEKVIDQLKKTKLANNVFVLSNEEIVNKLVELGVSEKLAKQVVAWHGSPHSFEKFTTNAMGTGEGAQAFGWGLYFTDLESIARNYAKKLSEKKHVIKTKDKVINLNKDVFSKAQDFAYGALERVDYDVQEAIKLLEYNQNIRPNNDNIEAIDILNNTIVEKERNLYKVSLHKGKEVGEYTWLEWDKKINKDQRNILANVFEKNKFLKEVKGFKKEIFIENDNLIGDDVYSFISDTLGGQKEASLFLLRAGIDGIKYPAESISRGATSDTTRGFNYVVFDENAVTVDEKIQFQRVADQLPLTLQVFERPEFVKLQGKQVNPITVLNSLNQSGIKQIEKDLIKQVIEDNYKEKNKVDYNELEATVRANIMPLERITTSSHSDYGMNNLGNGDYGNAKTLIFNAPIEHGVIGHFPGDFKASGRQNIKYQPKQLNDNTWVAVEEGYESQANDNNIYQYVGTAGTKEAVDEWIENYENPGNLLLEEDNSLTIRVSPTTQAIRDSFPEVDVVKVELLKNGEVVYVRSNTINNEDNEFLRKRAIENYNLSRGKELDRDTQAINKGMFGHIRVWQDGEVFTVAELQSDTYQKNKVKELFIKQSDINVKAKNNVKDKFFDKFVFEKTDKRNRSQYVYEYNGQTLFIRESDGEFDPYIDERGLVGDYKTLEEAKEVIKQNLDFLSDENFIKELEKEKIKVEQEFLKNFSPQEKQFIASQKIWEQRMVREAIKEASLSGANSLRFPTPYTLSVIEGYIIGETSNEEVKMPYSIISAPGYSAEIGILEQGSIIRMGMVEYLVVTGGEKEITVVDKDHVILTTSINENMNKDLQYQEGKLTVMGTAYNAYYLQIHTENFGQPSTYNKKQSKETFDIETSLDRDQNGEEYTAYNEKTGKEEIVRTQRTVAYKYLEIAELLKKEKTTEIVTDENGFDWYEAKITQEDAQKPVVAFQKTPKDITMTTSGFVYKGSVYLNEDKMKLDTPVHEFGHLYLNWLKSERGDLYQKGLELAQSEDAKEYADYVEKTQPNLTGEDKLNEILAQAIGDNGAKLVDKSWIENLWDEIKKLFGLSQYTNKQVQNMNLEQFTKAIAVDLYKEQLFQEMQGYKKAEVFMEVDGEIVQAKNTNTAVILPLVAKQVNNIEILSDINQIQRYDLDVLQANQEDTVKVLKEIEDNLINEGIDVAGLSSKEIDENLMQFLSVMENFLNSPTKNNTDSFSEIYDEYFEKDVRPKIENVKQEETDRDFVRLDTNLSEEDVYEQQGLIKVKEGLYIVTDKQDLDILYKNLETYKDKYPKDITLKEYVQKQISTLENFKSSDNAEAVYLYKMYFDLEKKIRQQNKQLERKIPIFTKRDLESNKKAQEAKRAFENYTDIILPLSANYQDLLVLMDYISNGEVLDKLPYNLIEEDYSVTELDVRNLISKYERALDRLEVVDSNLKKLSLNKTDNISKFTGDFNYLTTDFVSDFYIKILKEREKNSEIYKNFYSNFDVNERGIYLKNNDPITLSQVKEYADENLKQYSIVSKQLPLLMEQEIQYDTKQSRRDNVINNPQNIDKYQGQFHKINDNNVIVKNSNDEFIKVYGELYEAMDTEGNLTLYSRLSNNVGEYYNLNNKAPKTNVKVEEYIYLETQPNKFISEKSYLSKAEKKKINQENFNCIK